MRFDGDTFRLVIPLVAILNTSLLDTHVYCLSSFAASILLMAGELHVASFRCVPVPMQVGM